MSLSKSTLSKSTRSCRGVARAAVVGVAMVAIVAGGGVAWAKVTDNLVPTHGGPRHDEWCHKGSLNHQRVACQTDNSYVTYHRQGSLEHRDKVVVGHAIKLYRPGPLSFHHRPHAKYHGAAETDIIYQEGRVPGSDEGYTWCNDPLPKAANWYGCDQQYVRIQGGGYYKRGLACHETGHAVGLVHGKQATPPVSNQRKALRCMRKTPALHDKLGKNNRQNINQTY
ncbi:MAG: hypothetical protein ACRDP4_06470 [Nocardioidaceae bacterium]